MHEQLATAAESLRQDPRILAVYAFGSQVSGATRPGSDLDLAVLLDRPLDLQGELRLRGDLVTLLDRDDIDLVVLNLAPPLLRYEIVTGGRRLFTRDDEAMDRFERQAILRYFDTAHLRRLEQGLARQAARS